jgi:hypothetical protein
MYHGVLHCGSPRFRVQNTIQLSPGKHDSACAARKSGKQMSHSELRAVHVQLLPGRQVVCLGLQALVAPTV